MTANTKTIKSVPLKSAREVAAMLKQLPRDERLRIEGAIAWAGMARTDKRQDDTVQDSA